MALTGNCRHGGSHDRDDSLQIFGCLISDKFNERNTRNMEEWRMKNVQLSSTGCMQRCQWDSYFDEMDPVGVLERWS